MTKPGCLVKVFHTLQSPKLPTTATSLTGSTDPPANSQPACEMEITSLLSDTKTSTSLIPPLRPVLWESVTPDNPSTTLVLTAIMFPECDRRYDKKDTCMKEY